jgi:kynurenine formamidase
MKTTAVFQTALLCFAAIGFTACAPATTEQETPEKIALQAPKEVVDLGTLITESTPGDFWGAHNLANFGFTEENSFRDIENFEPTYFVDSYYTLFNHGGPHVDAPNHTEQGTAGLDALPLSSFYGPVKAFDYSHLPQGGFISRGDLESKNIEPGDIVLVYTGYQPPGEGEAPTITTLTMEAAEFLAGLPVRAFGTDGLSLESFSEFNARAEAGAADYESLLPIHYAFLTKDIPGYEQLVNVDKLIGRDNAFFVGVPLNIKDANGMLVRPVAFIY